MQRREFIRKGCSLCLAASAGFMMGSLSSCSSLPVYKTVMEQNKISVPLSLFAENDLQIVRAKNSEYDIALRKEKDETYTALLMRCTHADNPLTATGNGVVCHLHGSRFDPEGQVIKGPAEKALHQYSTQLTSENIIITIN